MAKLTEEDTAALACAPGQKDRLVFNDTLPGLAVRGASPPVSEFKAMTRPDPVALVPIA